ERAARQGLPNAQFSLAVGYLRGDGVRLDPVRGYAWLVLCADQGFAQAIRARPEVKAKLTADQLADAGRLARKLSAEMGR
ncbi:MAG: sel1 repeat family protein, partial [Dehalococcoidia bacterium]|nr:sel1 repeat family protein [Dehalococcoidia bacterium]